MNTRIKHQVNTELLTLEEVANNSIGFVIPCYQRPYVWSEDDVVKLFDDIKEAFLAKEPQYFIGSLLSAIRETEKLGETYELIDGQQRTTTLMLIALAFKKAGVESKLSDTALLNDSSRLTFEIRNVVQNLLGSYAGLKKLTKPGEETIASDPYLKHLDANLTVLIGAVATLVKEENFDLTGLADYFYSCVVWVNNIVPTNMDLNRLFSNMNTAGLQLEPVDLLKAKLFKKIRTEKNLYSHIWQACEHTNNYFERNVKQLFPNADWNTLTYKDLSTFNQDAFTLQQQTGITASSSKSISELIIEEKKKNEPENVKLSEQMDAGEDADIDDETVYCRSIISFELLLIHTLRIFFAQKGEADIDIRIKSANLIACFERLAERDEDEIKRFINLLWEVRYQFDTWIVKWVEHDDREDPQLRLTNINRSLSSGKYYINRSARKLGDLVQLQAVRNFTGDRSAHYWIAAFLGKLVEKPHASWSEALAILEALDNEMSLSQVTQKEASFNIIKSLPVKCDSWTDQAKYFDQSIGTSFEHYWFQKLEYLLWKRGDAVDNSKSVAYRITSKNSVEHVHPQNEIYKNEIPDKALHAFGNLVLLSPGENSSYSNKSVVVKKAEFDSKPKYDSLKLKAIFTLYETKKQWTEVEVRVHQENMLMLLAKHYQQGNENG